MNSTEDREPPRPLDESATELSSLVRERASPHGRRESKPLEADVFDWLEDFDSHTPFPLLFFNFFTIVYQDTFEGTPCAITFTDVNSGGVVVGPGVYDVRDSEGGCSNGYPDDPTSRTPSPADIETMYFRTYDDSGSEPVFAACGSGENGSSDGNECVRVPEPSTYLLMLTGIMGLGFVAWRRRETLA